MDKFIMQRIRNKCLMCKTQIKGRSDKKFCSIKCKSAYHHKLRSVTSLATAKIDKILHRNRSILLEIMGKNRTQIKVPLLRLEEKKFNFAYLTKFHINSSGKTYHYVYDFSWMTFSDDEVLINRRR
jgi:hypothetical protein